jgi:hypothetical protein
MPLQSRFNGTERWMVMGMREMLLELIKQNPSCIDLGAKSCRECQYGSVGDCRSECLADHLIANDVVTVVRCRDCKHSGSFKYGRFCENIEQYVDDDFFCADGERKDNG